MPITYTKLTWDDRKSASKTLSVKNGKLVTEGRKGSYKGTFTKVETTWLDFVDSMISGEAFGDRGTFIPGVIPEQDGDLRLCLKCKEDHSKGMYSRSKENFQYPETDFLLVLDLDKCENLPDAEAVERKLRSSMPTLGDVDMLISDSTSSRIKNIDLGLRGDATGYHVYIPVRGSDTNNLRDRLEYESWCSGDGWVYVTESGNTLRRCLIDLQVFQPTRLIYEALPTLVGTRFSFERRKPYLATEFSEDPLDLDSIEPLTDDENQTLDWVYADMAESEDVSKRTRAATASFAERNSLSVKQVERLNSGRGTLPSDLLLHPVEGDPLTVGEIMASPEKHAGRDFRDPLDPNYMGGSAKAKLYVNENSVQLNSYAHGEKSWELEPVKKKAGEVFDAVKPKKRKDKRAKSSRANGAKGGRPKTPVAEIADSMMEAFPNFLYCNGEFFDYSPLKGVYRSMSKPSYEGKVMGYLRSTDPTLAGKGTRDNVLANMSADNARNCIPAEDDLVIPLWRTENEDGSFTYESATGWVAMKNDCVINIDKLARGDKDARLEYTPELVNTHKFDYEYDPEAKCPRWLKYLEEVQEGRGEDIRMLKLLFGLSIAPMYKYAIIPMLDGEGGTGKSLCLSILKDLVGGQDNVSNLTLEQMSEKYKMVELMKKTVNINEEMASDGFDAYVKGAEEAQLRNVSSHGPMTGEIKYGGQVVGRARAVCWFAANKIPRFADTTDGIWRRLRIVPFNKKFRGSEMDVDLYSKLKEELPGILNWALEGRREVLSTNREFYDSPSSLALKEEHRHTCDPTRTFVEEHLVKGGMFDLQGELFPMYCMYMAGEGNDNPHKGKLVAAIKKAFPNISNDPVRIEGKQVKRWVGASIKQQEELGYLD